jgi:hypothetical protein
MVMCLKPLLNVVFTNGFLKEPLLNSFADFFDLTFALLLPPITFALTGCPSHCSLIPIQRSKNKNLKTKIPLITNPFHLFLYVKKRDEGEETKKRK